ncbi:hypothetical protein K458DRAFT_432157 [Lentithecium fluviatile CBS 122367]|uniref:Uncharacterized protein n=1 Tax=Lentithecium fluviatile CBS 122367 TaxID=1168545 RepID=A0A6G1IZF2_9PLEO|nr:hypothetical protein K458DRAFT_432157 [Lentithecium fluviatile CBS 122367]
MACSYGVKDIEGFQAAKALAAVEQPRPAANQISRRALPHAEPCRQSQSFLLEKLVMDCRLLVWKHVHQVPYTRVERWRPPYYGVLLDALDADCFPYRLSTPNMEATKKEENPIALLLSCRQIPFYQNEGLQEWEDVFQSLEKMPSLRQLQIWFYHGRAGQPKELGWARRPWEESMGSEAVEQKHRKLFDLFATAHVPEFTVNLTWKPDDLLSQREWPFKINVHTYLELLSGMAKFPYPLESDMYN